MSNFVKYTKGQLLGTCVFIKDAGYTVRPSGSRSRTAIFKCICGKHFKAQIQGVRDRSTTTCGCRHFQKKALTKMIIDGKNMRHSVEYKCWNNMKKRCYNPKTPGYKNWGGRGILVCERWKTSFEAFLEDVGRRPSGNHSLDRYPNKDGNYEPGNVRWATQKEQMRNVNFNRIISYNGVTLCAKDWADGLGIPYSTLRGRLDRGFSLEKALVPHKYDSHMNIKSPGQ